MISGRKQALFTTFSVYHEIPPDHLWKYVKYLRLGQHFAGSAADDEFRELIVAEQRDENEEDLTNQFHKMYALGNALNEHYDLDNYVKAMQYYLNMALSLAMDDQDIINSYKTKLAVNHKRQETNY